MNWSRLPEQTKIAAGFACAFLMCWILILAGNALFPFHELHSCLYSGLIIVWIVSVRQRIIHPGIRGAVQAGAGMLLFLFLLRMCRWSIFAGTVVPKFDQYLQYSYYLVFVGVPVTFLAVAWAAEDETADLRKKRGMRPVLLLALLLCLLVMTNPLHGLLYPLRGVSGMRLKALETHGPLYYIVVLWCLILSLSAFGLLMRHCMVSASRRLWYVPILMAAAAVTGLAVYFVHGGSPAIGSVKLYHIHEMFALAYLGVWEACFLIGLIPTNAGYLDYFRTTGINSCIQAEDGSVIYRSARTEAADVQTAAAGLAADGPDASDQDFRTKTAAISGGTVSWSEDLSLVHRLQSELKEALSQIQSENTLLEYEAEIKEKAIRTGVRNHLYDTIANTVRPEVTRLRQKIDGADNGADALGFVMVLGTFIKRQANMMLVVEETGTLDVRELFFAVRETLDHLSVLGIRGDVRLEGGGSFPPELLLRSYRVFEAVAEAALERGGSLMVNLGGTPGFHMHVMTDLLVDDGFLPVISHETTKEVSGNEEETVGSGLMGSLLREEGVTYLRLSDGREEGRG